MTKVEEERMQSIWSSTTKLEKRQELPGDTYAENVVIGAGMAGILIAYFLQKKGLEVIVIEAERIAGGQTKNTTAKITSQHGLIYHEMIRKAGMERAKGYAAANEEAIGAFEKTIEEEGISCGFQRLPSFLYSQKEEGEELLRKEAEAARRLGIDAVFLEKEELPKSELAELPFAVSSAVRYENQAQFQPLEFIQALSKKLTVYENTNAVSVHGDRITTNRGTITAKNIIFAVHYPFLIVPGFYPARQHQERSYVLALAGEGVPKKLSAVYYGIDEGGISLRSAEGRLLFGAGAHRTGRKEGCFEKTGYSYLRQQAGKYYPKAEECKAWAAQDCMTHDRLPFIGRYSLLRPHWYVATGFQKWGMTTSMIAAGIISDMISGVRNPYEEVFTPQRLLFRAGSRNLCMDIGISAAGLGKGLFAKKERRCRHMGCGLVWNEEEESYDCPCHGSRYDKAGNLLDNPAQSSLHR